MWTILYVLKFCWFFRIIKGAIPNRGPIALSTIQWGRPVLTRHTLKVKSIIEDSSLVSWSTWIEGNRIVTLGAKNLASCKPCSQQKFDRLDMRVTSSDFSSLSLSPVVLTLVVSSSDWTRNYFAVQMMYSVLVMYSVLMYCCILYLEWMCYFVLAK